MMTFAEKPAVTVSQNHTLGAIREEQTYTQNVRVGFRSHININVIYDPRAHTPSSPSHGTRASLA